ncbi:MAG: hypothetical protein R6X22_12805 [Gemmatimonadota bacterium]
MRRTRLPIVMAVLALVACGDPYKPLLAPNPLSPTEVTLFDFLTGALQDPSAFDLILSQPVRTDRTYGWDFVLLFDPSSGASVRTRGAFLDEPDEAGVQVVGQGFEELAVAPEGGYVQEDPVAIEPGDVFVARSRRNPSYGSIRCRYFGKFEVVAVDGESGSVILRHLINPNCERRELEPGEAT